MKTKKMKWVWIFVAVLGLLFIKPLTASAAAPAAPSDLRASTGTTNGIDKIVTLYWTDNSNNEDRFTIYRKVAGAAGWTPVGTVPTNTKTFNDSSITFQPDVKYIYMVQAYSTADGYSASSNEVTLIFPAVPTNITATSGPSGISLNWKNNTIHPVSIYVLRQDFPKPSIPMPINGSDGFTNKTTFLDTTAVVGETYVYLLMIEVAPWQRSFSAEVTATRLAYNTVTVNSGTGGGTYAVGTNVDIKANAAPSGKAFDKWTSTGVSLSNPGSANTSFTMPANAVTVTATYKDLPSTPASTYNVTVHGGSTNKTNPNAGETVTITANTAPEGKIFEQWITADGVVFADARNAVTTFVMPTKNVAVEAVFKDRPAGTFAINILSGENGTASANISAAKLGEEIFLTAEANEGYRFVKWLVTMGNIEVISNRFIMPGEDVTIEAIFESDAIIGVEDEIQTEDNNHFNWMWILFGVLAVVAVGGGIAFVIIRKKGIEQSSNTSEEK